MSIFKGPNMRKMHSTMFFRVNTLKVLQQTLNVSVSCDSKGVIGLDDFTATEPAPLPLCECVLTHPWPDWQSGGMWTLQEERAMIKQEAVGNGTLWRWAPLPRGRGPRGPAQYLACPPALSGRGVVISRRLQQLLPPQVRNEDNYSYLPG